MKDPLAAIAAAAPTIAMLGVFACLVGGVAAIGKRRDYKRGWLMLVMAVVLLVNVAIWTF